MLNSSNVSSSNETMQWVLSGQGKALVLMFSPIFWLTLAICFLLYLFLKEDPYDEIRDVDKVKGYTFGIAVFKYGCHRQHSRLLKRVKKDMENYKSNTFTSNRDALFIAQKLHPHVTMVDDRVCARAKDYYELINKLEKDVAPGIHAVVGEYPKRAKMIHVNSTYRTSIRRRNPNLIFNFSLRGIAEIPNFKPILVTEADTPLEKLDSIMAQMKRASGDQFEIESFIHHLRRVQYETIMGNYTKKCVSKMTMSERRRKIAEKMTEWRDLRDDRIERERRRAAAKNRPRSADGGKSNGDDDDDYSDSDVDPTTTKGTTATKSKTGAVTKSAKRSRDAVQKDSNDKKKGEKSAVNSAKKSKKLVDDKKGDVNGNGKEVEKEKDKEKDKENDKEKDKEKGKENDKEKDKEKKTDEKDGKDDVAKSKGKEPKEKAEKEKETKEEDKKPNKMKEDAPAPVAPKK